MRGSCSQERLLRYGVLFFFNFCGFLKIYFILKYIVNKKKETHFKNTKPKQTPTNQTKSTERNTSLWVPCHVHSQSVCAPWCHHAVVSGALCWPEPPGRTPMAFKGHKTRVWGLFLCLSVWLVWYFVEFAPERGGCPFTAAWPRGRTSANPLEVPGRGTNLRKLEKAPCALCRASCGSSVYKNHTAFTRLKHGWWYQVGSGSFSSGVSAQSSSRQWGHFLVPDKQLFTRCWSCSRFVLSRGWKLQQHYKLDPPLI